MHNKSKANYIKRSKISRLYSSWKTYIEKVLNKRLLSYNIMISTKQTAIFHFAIGLTIKQQHCYNSHIKKGHTIHMKCFMQILLPTRKTNSFKCNFRYTCILLGETVRSIYFIFLNIILLPKNNNLFSVLLIFLIKFVWSKTVWQWFSCWLMF